MKTLEGADLLELLLQEQTKQKLNSYDLKHFLYTMAKTLNPLKASKLIVMYTRHETLFEVIIKLTDENMKRLFVKHFFSMSINYDHVNYAIRCMWNFETMLRSDNRDCMSALLTSLDAGKAPYYLEHKLQII
jgi:hypothetical protein